MPPKTCSAPGKKTEEKKKEKVIEDKTFGLKNKKGAKQQKFIQQVQCQVKQQSGDAAKKTELEKKKEKDKKQKELDELNALFKCVEQVVPKGVDPKSIVCEAFKKAKCSKGDKCKFSHDLNVNRKTQKINIYEDKRDQDPKKPGTVSSTDDPERLDIVCKYFVEAVEKKLYGWFWVCPNGGNACKYRHALPEGYVLKNQKPEDANEGDEISLEDLIEKERAMITDTTKITLSSFLKWKKQKLKEKEEQRKTITAKKQADFQKDNKTQGLSGREMFTFQSKGDAYEDSCGDDQAVFDCKQEDEENGEGETPARVVDIDLEQFSMQIIEENEAELAKQLAGELKSNQSATGSKQTSSGQSSFPNGDSSCNSHGVHDGMSLEDTAMDDEPEPGPSGSGCNGTGFEIDEELFAQEINQLEDLDISDDEDDDTNSN